MRAFLKPGDQFATFTIDSLLGAGGSGDVYLAEDHASDQLVALKLLPQDFYHRRRFKREADALKRLRHRNIPELLSASCDLALPYCYLATEYVDGVTLRELLNELFCLQTPCASIDTFLLVFREEQTAPSIGRAYGDTQRGEQDHDELAVGQDAYELPVPDAATNLVLSESYIRRCCELVLDVAQALDHAHRQSMLHRDIKPENIMLDRSGRVVLIDFGIVRFLGKTTMTGSGALVGTTKYTSPEQLDPDYVEDRRSDIYSLGIVLYELLTLRHPIVGSAIGEILREIEEKAILPVRQLNGSVPRSLEAVVHKACAKDPEKRYASASEFALDLQAFLDGRAVRAPWYRYTLDLGPIVKKRPLRMTIAGIILSSCVILTILAEIGPLVQSTVVAGIDRAAVALAAIIIAGTALLLGLTTYAVFYGHKAIWIFAPLVMLATASFNALLLFSPSGAGWIVRGFTAVFCGATLLAYTPTARRWFATSESIRRRHRERGPY